MSSANPPHMTVCANQSANANANEIVDGNANANQSASGSVIVDENANENESGIVDASASVRVNASEMSSEMLNVIHVMHWQN